MLRRLANWLGRRGDSGDAESEERAGERDESDEGGFLPSRLDASVLESHGMGTTAAEQELKRIEENAERVESNRPDDHEHRQ